MSKMQNPDVVTSTPKESEEYIKVGMSTCGIAAGADEIFNTLQAEIQKRGLPVKVSKCGCIGMCFAEPLVEVKVMGLPVVRYGKVNKAVALDIVEKHLVEKQLVNGYIYDNE
jgi:NADP-reducing hydrogenase subunit HndB